MNNIDLNTDLGFARAVMGDVAGILQQLNHVNPKDWDIVEGSFNGVKFMIFKNNGTPGVGAAVPQVEDSGGRRKVFFKYPYVDGQTSDDLGRNPESFHLDIVLFGINYLNQFAALMTELNKPTPGVLVHPVRGEFQCVMLDYSIIHSNESRKALALRLTMAEHTFTAASFKQTADKSVHNFLSQALTAFGKIDAVFQTIAGSQVFVSTLIASITGLLTDIKAGTAQNLASINQSFNPGGGSDFPALLPTNQGGVLNSDGTFSGNTFGTATPPNDPFASVPLQSEPTNAAAVTQTKATVDSVNATRTKINQCISLIEGGANGLGALFYYAQILSLKQVANLLQNALQAGIQSSNAKAVTYVVPRLMTVREVAFAIGISLDRCIEIELLNPQLDSVNYIVKDTILQVPA